MTWLFMKKQRGLCIVERCVLPQRAPPPPPDPTLPWKASARPPRPVANTQHHTHTHLPVR